MLPIDALSQTVQEALRTGQIGTPVAVRIVAHVSADHGKLEPEALRLLQSAADWLQSTPAQLTAFGGAETGQISTLTKFENGRSALVSVGSCGVGPPLLEVVVWGHRGILSWEGEDRFTWNAAAEEHHDLSDQAQRLRDQIRDALLSRGAGAAGSRDLIDKSAPRPLAQKPPYGVLLVAGDNTHQPNYAEALAADKRCRLVALSDEADVTPRRQRLNEQMARRLGIPFLPDLGQALARDDVHVVSICAEPARRGPIIVQAANAGKHLYLDKPLAGSPKDADQIVAAVQKARVVGHMFSLVRSDPAMRIRNLVHTDQLGELSAVHCDLCFAKGEAGTASLDQPRRETPSPDRYEFPDSKRELSNVGVYPLVMLLWLLGKPVRRVFATTGNYFFREHQQNGTEDFGQMLLQLEGGTTAGISVGRTGWRSHPSGGLNRTYLIGTKETAVVDAHRPRLTAWADVEPWSAPQRDPEDPMGMWSTPRPEQYTPRPKQAWTTATFYERVSDAAYFLDCIEDGRPSDVPASLAAAVTEVLLAGYRSAATGNVITLP